MRSSTLLGRLALAGWLAALSSGAGAQLADRKPRVAVLDFDDNTPTATAGASLAAVGRGISAELLQKLSSAGRYILLDRSEVKRLLDRENDSEAGPSADPYALAARIGQQLGLDAMIVGAVTRYGPSPAPAGGGTGLHGPVSRKSKAYVDVTARVLNMTSGEVLCEFAVTGESKGEGDVLRFEPSGRTRGDRVVREILGSDFLDTLFAQAERDAVDKLSARLNAFAGQIPLLQVAVEGLVAEVAGNSITINLGRKSGVKVGDQLAILRPAAGAAQDSRPLVQKIAEARVTEVGDGFATAELVQSARVQIGDRVQAMSDAKTAPR